MLFGEKNTDPSRTAELVKTAKSLIRAGYAVMPVSFPVLPTEKGQPQVYDKRPMLKKWQEKAIRVESEVDDYRKLFEEGHGLGIVHCLSGTVAIDVDVKKGKTGLASLAKYLADYRVELDLAPSFSTPSGGMQYIFARPSSLADVKGNFQEVWPGIDIVCGFSVVPPSSSPVGSYEDLAHTLDRPPGLPKAVEAMALERVSPPAKSKSNGTPSPAGSGIKVTEGHRHTALIDAIGAMHRKGMSEATILAAMIVLNRESFSPPEDEAEIERQVQHICRTYKPGDPIHGTSKSVKDEQGADFNWRDYVRPVMSGYNPSIDYLLEPWLIRGQVHLMLGAAQSGKTTLVVDWANRVALQQKRVLYAILESRPHTQRFFMAWANEHRTEIPESLMDWGEKEPLRLSHPMSGGLLRDVCRDGKIDMLIVDTYAVSMTGADENSSQETQLALAQLDAIAYLGVAVVVIHHLGKDQTRGARGSSALESGTDTVFLMKKPDGQSHELFPSKYKGRDPERGSWLFDRTTVDLDEWTPGGERVTAPVLTYRREIEQARAEPRAPRKPNAVTGLSEKIMFYLDRDGPMRRIHLAQSCGARGESGNDKETASFERAMRELFQLGFITKSKGKRGEWKIDGKPTSTTDASQQNPQTPLKGGPEGYCDSVSIDPDKDTKTEQLNLEPKQCPAGHSFMGEVCPMCGQDPVTNPDS